jgi:hypothetical protein
MKKTDKIKIRILLFSLIVYAVSLTQTAFTYNGFDGQKTISSLEALFMGMLAILGGGMLEWIIWLANPLYFFGIITFFYGRKLSIKASFAATALAFSFTTWKEILVSENGRTAKIESLNSGYWLWLSSLAILALGTIYYLRRYEKI